VSVRCRPVDRGLSDTGGETSRPDRLATIPATSVDGGRVADTTAVTPRWLTESGFIFHVLVGAIDVATFETGLTDVTIQTVRVGHEETYLNKMLLLSIE